MCWTTENRLDGSENVKINSWKWFHLIDIFFLCSQSQIDDFVAQQPGLESNLKNLSQNIAKYLERYTEVYDRDIQRISEVFSKVHQTLQADTVTSGYFLSLLMKTDDIDWFFIYILGNRELSNSVSKISSCYGNIGELYKTKVNEMKWFHLILWLWHIQASDGLRDFHERLQEYIGLVGCFPSIFSIQKVNEIDFQPMIYR